MSKFGNNVLAPLLIRCCVNMSTIVVDVWIQAFESVNQIYRTVNSVGNQNGKRTLEGKFFWADAQRCTIIALSIQQTISNGKHVLRSCYKGRNWCTLSLLLTCFPLSTIVALVDSSLGCIGSAISGGPSVRCGIWRCPLSAVRWHTLFRKLFPFDWPLCEMKWIRWRTTCLRF